MQKVFVLPMLLSFIFFSTVPLETNYLIIYRTDLYQHFKIGTYMGGHDQSDLLFTIAEGMLLS